MGEIYLLGKLIWIIFPLHSHRAHQPSQDGPVPGRHGSYYLEPTIPRQFAIFHSSCMSCQCWVEIKNNNNISSSPSASLIPTVGIIITSSSTKKKKFLICFFAPSSFLFNRSSCALYERPKCRVSHKKGVAVAAGLLALLARPGRSTLAHYFSVLFS